MNAHAPLRPFSGRLLLVTAVRLRESAEGLLIDDQTAAGLERWADHFSSVTYVGIHLEEGAETDTSATWVPVRGLAGAERMRVLALPMAYRIPAFAKSYRRVRRLLAAEIGAADHLCFTLGYLAGDWAAVAALEARAQKRRHAVWFDRVEHEVLRRGLSALPLKRRVKEAVSLRLMLPYHRRLIRGSSLGLFQGLETFDAYAPDCPNPACVYDVHTHAADFAPPAVLSAKTARLLSGAPLDILYVGRAADMKGPMDWLAALSEARRGGVAFRARWLGDGPRLAQMKAEAERLGLADCVEFPGFVSDRAAILEAMRRADLLMFCHKTPESPRCLVEALVSACPLVGYRGRYAEGLVEAEGGGLFVPMDDAAALGQAVAALDADRPRLAALVHQAAKAGRGFDEAAVYAERARLIATHA